MSAKRNIEFFLSDTEVTLLAILFNLFPRNSTPDGVNPWILSLLPMYNMFINFILSIDNYN